MGWTKRDFITQAFEEIGLGIKFNGRTSDKARAAKIQSTLEQA